MSIRRSATIGDRVAVLQRSALQDTSLSFRARGILCAVLSRPADWRTSADRLARETPTEGRDAIQTALRELQTAGYLKRTRVQDAHGHWTWTWDLTDEAPTEPSTVAPSATTSPQVSDIPAGHTENGSTDFGSPEFGSAPFLEGSRGEGSREQTPPTPRDDAASPAAEDQQSGGGDDHDEPEDQPAPDGVTHPRHEKDEHTRRAITRHLNNNQLPTDLLYTTLAACYRIGRGDPWRAWTESGIRTQLTEDLDRVRNVSAVIRSRFRDMPILGPVKTVTTPCPDHPDQPAGRCNTCAHTTMRMPDGWRAATRKTAQTEGATAA